MTRMYGDTIVSGAALRCLLGIMGVVSVLTCALSASGEPIPDEDRTITLYQQLAPATVFLSVTHGPAHPFSSSPTTGVGAGFVVDEDGTVVTNAHVVEEARGVMATLYDGRRISAAIVGVDPVSDDPTGTRCSNTSGCLSRWPNSTAVSSETPTPIT